MPQTLLYGNSTLWGQKLGNNLRRLQDYGLKRDIRERALIPNFHFGNLIDNIHALNDFAEDSVSVSAPRRIQMRAIS